VNDGARVVLIGAPGAGKTRTGKRLARLLEVPFIDTDRRIVDAHGPIAELFDTHGEPHFRAIEKDVVAAALSEEAVVALGGGAVLDADTQARLEGYRVVQLSVSPHAVEARIAGGKRPLVKDGIGAWIALVEKRQPIYDRLAQLTIDTSRRPLDGVAEEIAEWLEKK
jgi:shikimate kinase